jgi:hypothetical protein
MLQPDTPGASRRTAMNKTLIALLAATAATLSLGAYADEALTHGQAGVANAQNKADYKADKQAAKDEMAANKANCRAETSGGVQHACKKDAKAQAKLDKADAKVDYKGEKADIKADTK